MHDSSECPICRGLPVEGSLHTLTGFKVFLDPGIAASAVDADDLAPLAAHQLEAIGVCKSTSNNTTLYMSVHSNNRC